MRSNAEHASRIAPRALGALRSYGGGSPRLRWTVPLVVASGLSQVAGATFQGNALPFQTIELTPDAKELLVGEAAPPA